MKKLFFAVMLLAAPAAAQDAPFTWKLQPEVGSKWQMRTFMRMKMTQNFPVLTGEEAKHAAHMPKKMDMVMLQKMTMNYDVVAKDDNGAFTVDLTYGELVNSTDVSIDGKPMPAQVRNQMNSALKPLQNMLKGGKLTMKVSPQGRLLSISGLDALKRRIGKSLQASTASLPGADTSSATMMLNKEFFESAFQAGQLPTSPIEFGRGYSYALQLSMGMPFRTNIFGTRILTERANGVATFAETASFDFTDLNKLAPKEVDLKLDMTMKGNSIGKTTVDEVSGMTLSGDQTMRYEGLITIPNPETKQQLKMPFWARMQARQVMEPRP